MMTRHAAAQHYLQTQAMQNIDHSAMVNAVLKSSPVARLASLVLACVAVTLAGCSAHDTADASIVQQESPAPPEPLPQASRPQADRSGLTRVGVASFYADWFAGREMANGTPMDPGGDNAASRTLPIGTTAKVTNIATGRLVDLSPATAQKIGITRSKGVARVKVSPIAVPLPDGGVKAGAAAHDPEVPQLR
jgi:rare lipoprotein A